MRSNHLVKAFKSSALAAFLLFCAVDIGFREYVNSGGFDRFEASQHRSTYWEIKQYRGLPAAPDVLMIGSSLLVRIVSDGESTYLNRPINSIKHNRSVHFEDAVEKRTGVRPSTFAFDLHGLHASDAAVLLNGSLGDKLPGTIIYTLAPRDFVDNMLLSPDTTEQYRLMSHISDLKELKLHAKIHSMDQAATNFFNALSNIFFTLNCKTEVASAFEREWRKDFVPALEAHIVKAEPPRELYLGVTPFDYPEEMLIAPETTGEIPRFDNLKSYAICYKPFRRKNYAAQLYYFDYLLKFARDRGINMILVNMPLRKDNLSAMVPGILEKYKSDVKEHAARYGAKFVDLYDTDKYVDADFMDSAHLTGHGAMKFVEAMADALAPEVAADTLSRQNRTNQVAHQKQSTTGIANRALFQ